MPRLQRITTGGKPLVEQCTHDSDATELESIEPSTPRSPLLQYAFPPYRFSFYDHRLFETTAFQCATIKDAIRFVLAHPYQCFWISINGHHRFYLEFTNVHYSLNALNSLVYIACGACFTWKEMEQYASSVYEELDVFAHMNAWKIQRWWKSIIVGVRNRRRFARISSYSELNNEEIITHLCREYGRRMFK